jgi:putative ABC transport system substrate-binding protein
MNNRRKLVIGLGASALTAPFSSFAQQQEKPVRVAILERTSADKYKMKETVFVDTMRELGWVEGHNIVYDRVFANDDILRLPALAADLVKRGPKLIYTSSGGSSDAAVAATRTIPIVLGSQSSLVERGWVQSLAHPGGNVTGILNIGQDLGAKRLQLLKMALPKVTRVGVLVNLVIGAGAKELKLIEQAASGQSVNLISARVKHPSELNAAFALFAKSRIEALLTTQNDLFLAESQRIFDLASKQRVPVIAHRGEMVEDGAIMSYSSVLNEQIRRAAHLVDKILKGAKPADIPIEQPTKFELVVNLKTAKTLGIRMPSAIMLQATRVIE